MKFKALTITLVFAASMMLLQGCRLVSSDVDTEQEILKILEEKAASENGDLSDNIIVFDDEPDKSLQVSDNEQTDLNNSYESGFSYEDPDTTDGNNKEITDDDKADSSEDNSQPVNDSVKTPESENVDVNADSETSSSGSGNSNQVTYVLNKNTKKFHYTSCGSVSQIKAKNYAEAAGRDSIIASGYQPCKRCNP